MLTCSNFISPACGQVFGGAFWISDIIGFSSGKFAIASTRSMAVIAASVAANVSTRKPSVMVKLDDQIISSPTVITTRH